MTEATATKVFHSRLVWTYDKRAKKGKWRVEADPKAPQFSDLLTPKFLKAMEKADPL